MKEPSYKEAFDDLQRIVEEMEQGEIGIDALSIKVQEAAKLIKFCRAKLKATELDVDQILKDLEENENTNP
jgi:exodeoxyribonuclease VII small subunit